jgi:hypothetical protein
VSHDPDLGPRLRGRAGAEIGSRLLLLIVLAVVLVVAAGVALLLRRGHHTAQTCANGDSAACDFAAGFTVRGYRQTAQAVSGGRSRVATYYVGPPATDYLALIAGPGLTLAPPASPMGTAKAPVLGAGGSTAPAFAGCAVLVYQIKPPQQRSFANPADSAAIAAGSLAMLEVGLTCAH